MTLATDFDTYADYCASNAAQGYQVIPERLFVSMKLDLDNRETKFSDAEFALLPRNDDGDVIDLSIAFIFLTPDHIELLSSDDWSRYDDYQEEMRCLMADAMAEFG